MIKVKFCLHALFSWNADVNFCLTLVLQGTKQFNRLGNLSLKFSAVLKRVGCINCWLTAIIPAEPFCREKKKKILLDGLDFTKFAFRRAGVNRAAASI